MFKTTPETDRWLREAKKGRPYGFARLGRGVILLSAPCVAEDDRYRVDEWIRQRGYLWWKWANMSSRKLRYLLAITAKEDNIKWDRDNPGRGKPRFYVLQIDPKAPDTNQAREDGWMWPFTIKLDGMETVTTVPADALAPQWKLTSTFFVRKKASKRPSIQPIKTTDSQGVGRIEESARSVLKEWLGSDRAPAAIVFTDIVGSTKLGNELGNEEMEKVRNAHFAQAKVMIDRQTPPGFLVKGLGDGLLVLFRNATTALEFAVSLVSDPGHERLSIRVGIHIGQVDIQAEDVFGNAVNYAARICQQFSRSGIWVSEEVKKQIEDTKGREKLFGKWKRHSKRRLKGFSGKHTLWEWRM